MSERGTGAPSEGPTAGSGSAARRQFDALAAVVDGGVVRIDADGCVAAATDAFVDQIGCERAAVVGEPVSDLFGDAAGVDAGLRRLRDAKSPDAATLPVVADVGARELELRSVVADDAFLGAVGVLRATDGRESPAERQRALDDVYDALTATDQTFVERLDRLLGVVREAVGTEFATLSRVSDDEYVFEAVQAPDGADLEPGDAVSPAELPVCGHVVETEQTLVLRDVQAEAPELADPEWGISCYVGAPVTVEGDVYGTFCFYGTAPADDAFSEWDATLVEFAANWVSHELEQRRTRERLRRRNQELEASEQRYRSLAENFSNGAVALVDHDLRYTTAGGRPVDAETETADELQGRTVREAVTEEFADVLEPKYRAALDGERCTFEYDTGDGVARIQTFPVRDDDGDVLAAMGMSQDVTEQKERERELSKYKALVETVNEGIYVVDDDYRYTTVNDAFVELSGYSREELLGSHASLLVDDATLEEAAAVRTADADGPSSLETTMERADGSEVPVEVTFTALESDDGGRERVGVVRDITERRERQRQLSALVDNVPGMVYRCRNERGWPMEYVSEGCRGLTGYDSDALESGGVSYGDDVVVDEDQADLWADVQRGLETDGSFLVSYRVETPDGETRWVRERGRGVYDEDGNLTELEGVIIDITERKRLESELEEILGRVTDAFYALDDEFRFTHVNERAEELLQASEAELLGGKLWEVYPEAAEIDEIWDAFHEAMESQESRSFELYYEPLEFWIEATVHPSETGVSVYFRDVTERREQRRRLEASEQRYRALVENFPNGAVGLFDEELRYTAVGGELMDQFDVSPESRVGRRVHDLYPDDLTEEVKPYLEAALDGETRSFDVEYSGSYLSARVLPIRGVDGGVDAGMLVVQDVTEQKEYERRLERTLDLLEVTERVADVGGWEIDPETMDVFWSDQLFDLLGVDADEEPPLEEALDVYHEDDRPLVEDAVEAALESGESFDVEVRFRRPDGEVRWLRVQGTPETEGDDVVSLRGAAQDVTEQKEREQFLEDAKAQMEAAAEAGAVGTWEWHVPEDRFVADAALAHLFGIDPERAREGVPLEALVSSIHEDDRERVQVAIEAAVESCGEYEAEYRVHDADGDLRWVVARGHVECDGDGNPQTFPGALTDITDQKRVERALDRQREQLETLFEVLPVGVVVADADGRVVDANDVAEDIWGDDVLDASSVADYGRYDARWESSGEPVAADEYAMAKVLRGEELPEPDVYEIPDADGSERVIMVQGMPVFDGDDVDRGVVTMTDVTERREYQRKLEASNERLEQFAYAASHDLQEPLRMVSSYLSLLEQRYGDALDEDAREFIEYAVDGADRMQEMIDGLLEYSRVETEGDSFEQVDLDAVFEDVRRDFGLRIEETDASVEAASLPTVRGDADQLRRVFANLLSNAIEYSGDDPPDVSVSASREGDEWVVAVSDDGIGIDPEHADRVFEVFQRLHTHDEHPGTGIGLALAERIVERHGGDIWVESEPGEGATFYFSVPDWEGTDD